MELFLRAEIVPHRDEPSSRYGEQAGGEITSKWLHEGVKAEELTRWSCWFDKAWHSHGQQQPVRRVEGPAQLCGD